jgi:hypothetical protein
MIPTPRQQGVDGEEAQTGTPFLELSITHNFHELRERPKGQRVEKKQGAADNTL